MDREVGLGGRVSPERELDRLALGKGCSAERNRQGGLDLSLTLGPVVDILLEPVLAHVQGQALRGGGRGKADEEGDAEGENERKRLVFSMCSEGPVPSARRYAEESQVKFVSSWRSRGHHLGEASLHPYRIQYAHGRASTITCGCPRLAERAFGHRRQTGLPEISALRQQSLSRPSARSGPGTLTR